MSINSTVLTGRLVKDPTSRTVNQEGLAVSQFTLAIDNPGQNKGTSFIDCTAWGKRAEVISKYVKKGQLLAVMGHLKQDVWEKDGQRNSKTHVIVDDFQFLTPKEAKEGTEENAPTPSEEVGLFDKEDFPKENQQEISLSEIPF